MTRTHRFDKVSEDGGQANADIEVVLHNEVFLGREEGAEAEESHVWAAYSSFVVECCKPFLGEDEHPYGCLVDRANPGWEVDQVPLLRSGGGEGEQSRLLGRGRHHLAGLLSRCNNTRSHS